MQVHTAQPQGWLQYAIPIAIFIVIFSFRLRRMSRLRPLKLEQLWIVPALYLLFVAGAFFRFPPTPIGWVFSVVGLSAGAAIGWQRGKTMQIHVDPETHALNQKASVAGMLFLVAIIAVKAIAQSEGSAFFHLDVALLTDVLAAFALGMFSMTRLEMYLRAKRLLEEARAARV